MSGRRKKRSHPATAAPPNDRRQRHPRPGEVPHRRLAMVTAVLVTRDDFPGELADSFPGACAALGLAPAERGYGLVLAHDEHGGRWTQITTDAPGVGYVRSIWQAGLACGYEPPAATVVAVRPGWPVECLAGLAGRGEPDDPAGVPAAGVVRAAEGRWSPARRRRMADIIAGELASMAGRTIKAYIEAERWDASTTGDTDLGPPPPRLIDMRARIEPGDPAYRVVDRALAAAWSLAVTGRPPPGSARTRRPG